MLVLIFLLFPLPRKEILLRAVLKGKFTRLVDALFDQTIDVLLEEAKTVIIIFSRTRPESFTKLGKYRCIQCMNTTPRKEESTNKQSTALLKNFQKNLNNNPEFKNTIEFDMVEHSIKNRWG